MSSSINETGEEATITDKVAASQDSIGVTVARTLDATFEKLIADTKAVALEIQPPNDGRFIESFKSILSSYEFCYLPAFHNPGWFLRYVIGPHTPELLEQFFNDVTAGITVALTLIPQGLSYAGLANLPPIIGLYTAVFPSAVYTFFGSSMALSVGPTAILSLLIGQLITDYGIEPGSLAAVELAGQATLCAGVILLILAVLNVGKFIELISFPVFR